MNFLFRLLTFLLCLELMVSPINPSLSFLASTVWAQSCPTGQQFDNVLNRCLTTTEAAKVLNVTANCSAGDKECYKQTAQEAFQEKVNKGEAPERKGDQGFMGTVGKIGASAGAVTYAILGFSKSSSACMSKSYWGMIAGGVAVFAGDTLANMQHKSRLKKIKEDWGKIVNPEQANGDKDKEREISIEAQSEAFEMLARSEDSLAKAAKMKKTFFTIGAAAYAVTAAVAGWEVYQGRLLESTASPAAAAYRVANTCAPSPAEAAPAPIPSGVWVYYTNPKVFDIKAEIQKKYNVIHSKDLVSLIANTDVYMGNDPYSPAQYEELRTYLKKSDIHQESFQTFKEISLSLLLNLNPLPLAVAQVETAPTRASNTQDNAKTSGVNTNAASAYKEVSAKGFDFMNLAAGAVAGAIAAKTIGPQLISSEGRLAFSGVMAALTMSMASHAGSEAENANKRAELLRKMKAEFASAAGSIYTCKSEDRNDPSKPNCYCYTSENQRNSNRNNSQICLKLWAGINVKPTNYMATTNSTKVCISNTRQPDPTCKCRANKSCMKVGLQALKGVNPATMSMLSSTIDPVNKIADGSLEAGSFDSGSLANQVARVQDFTKKLENHPSLSDYKKNKNKREASLRSTLEKGGAGLGSNVLGSTPSGGMPSNPGEAARMLEKEIKEEGPSNVGGSDSIATPSNEPPKEELEFGMTQEDLAAQEGQLAEVMKEDLDYGGSDINAGSKQNIFEVLSSRYQRSGMKRLFDEESAAPATSKAASTDDQKK